MRWATLDPDGRPTGFYHPEVHPELFEQVGGELRPRGPIAGAVPVTEADWQELLSHPGRRKLQGGRVVATEPPALPPDVQAAADRALLREAMLHDQIETWIEQRVTAPQGLSPDEIAAPAAAARTRAGKRTERNDVIPTNCRNRSSKWKACRTSTGALNRATCTPGGSTCGRTCRRGPIGRADHADCVGLHFAPPDRRGRNSPG